MIHLLFALILLAALATPVQAQGGSLTPADVAYVQAVQAQLRRDAESVDRYELAMQARSIEAFAPEFAIWQDVHAQLTALAPPSRFSDSHPALLEATGKLNDAATLLSAAILADDGELLVAGVQRYQEFFPALEEATRQLIQAAQ